MAIRYAVDLTDTERAALREIVSKNKAKRSTIINAYILLKADRACGWTNENIALAYEVSTKKVEQLKKRFVEEGFEAALYRKPVTNAHRRKITGDEEAHLIALFCSQAPEVGCLKMAAAAQFSCPGFGPREPRTPQHLGQLMGFSA